MKSQVELSEAECRFVWNESTSCAKAIPQRFLRTAPETGAVIKAEVLLKDMVAAPAPGQAEAEMARQHIAPAFRNFLAPTINLLAKTEGTARQGVLSVMGDAVAVLTSTSRVLPALTFILGVGSYEAYVSAYVQAAFARPEVREHPVSFAGQPVFCLPGLHSDVAFLPGGLVLECGPAAITLDPMTDVRKFSQKVKLELDSTRVVSWRGL